MGEVFLEGESKRGFLASLWSLVTILSAISFLTAFVYALSASEEENNYNYNNNEESHDEQEAEVAVTSRALAFSALWAGVLAVLLSVFGTVILGYKSPTGLYYTCCSSSVHQTTPLGIGSFIGALLMFANLTLVCSVLFGEFHVSSFHLFCCEQSHFCYKRRMMVSQLFFCKITLASLVEPSFVVFSLLWHTDS